MAGPLELTAARGPMAYGVTFRDPWRRGPYFVEEILKGTKQADLPIAQTTHIDLALNLKTAESLGIALPPLLTLRADEVIE